MKLKMEPKFYKRVVMFLCAAALLFAFTACGDEGEVGNYVMGSEAKLTGLRIATARVSSAQIPAPIHPDDWEDWDFEMAGVDTRTMYFQRDEDLVEVRIIPSTSKGASVKWGIGGRIDRPNEFKDVRVPASFKSEDYIYLWVKSEDQLTDSYYRFDAVVLKSGVNLADVFVDGKRYNVEDGHPQWNAPGIGQGDLPLTRDQSRNTKIRTVAFEETSKFRFARVAGKSKAAPSFGTRSTVMVQEGFVEDEDGNPTTTPKMVEYFNMGENFSDQDFLYVEVTAENGVDKAIYKFLVSVGRIATIDKLYLDNEEKHLSNLVMSKGTPNSSWVIVAPGLFEVAYYDQPDAGFKVNITLDDPEARLRYAVLTTVDDRLSDANFVTTPVQKFANRNALAIEITSQNGQVVNYYRVRVNLLATKFLEQPASTAYYYYYKRTTPKPAKSGDDYESPFEFDSDDGSNGGENKVKPLTFKLEDESKIASIQWYESNSWYGGYGFDVDGRVTFSGSANTADPDGTEEGFIEDNYHTKAYDEKSNITLFNGGNENVRYVINGRRIGNVDITAANMPENFNLSQGTSKEYTPKITFRPFLPGYTNETHYYWVVITDTNGYRVTSERATIVSERNKDKKHLIFDVNNYYDPITKEKIVFKNGPDPFKKKYDKYRIPLFFDSEFDINDYETVTAQAKFYLTDGKDWIQNWTQGNFSFEDKDKNILVLYYNLTNDNAAKSLVSGGNESGAGVFETPKCVVIEPSGDHTKGNNKDGYPLNPDGSFKTPKNLQGWFCGFIELVEFRFEGPRREED